MKTAASMGAPGKPNAAPTFFNGTDLAGWEAGCWRVEQGLLVGTVPTSQKALAVLRTTQKYKDFDLRFRVRLKEGSGNCAVRFRAQPGDGPDTMDNGPECIIHRTGEGKSYSMGSVTEAQTTDEIVTASTKAAASAKPGDFNRMQIHCEGKTVIVHVNGRIVTVCKSLVSVSDEGCIALELDGRQQAGEVAFKDFKFTDLTRADKAPRLAPPPANTNAMLMAESDYFQSVGKAKRQLLSSFDSAIKERTSQSSQSSQSTGKLTGTAVGLEKEKQAYLTKGQIPWSLRMRSATHDYLTELEAAQQRMEKTLSGELAAAGQRHDQEASEQLKALGDRILTPHVVATARFAGASLRFRSDGIVEQSDDETAGCWRISPDRHDDVIIETTDNSEHDNGARRVFRIAEDGTFLTETSGNSKHKWPFVEK
jgi:hypothetical protein